MQYATTLRPVALLAVVAAAAMSSRPAHAASNVVLLGGETPPGDAVEETVDISLPEFSRGQLNLGLELGPYSFRNEDYGAWLSDEFYMGIRYSEDLSLRSSYSVMAGYFGAKNKHANGDDIAFFPVRLQYEYGTFVGSSLSRWYVAAGGGYNFTDDLPSPGKESDWPLIGVYIDAEWIASLAVGVDLRNEGRYSSRVEVGTLMFLESDFEMLAGSFTLAYQF